MDVEAPRVARHCEPGQFVIVKMDEKANIFHLPFVITTERQNCNYRIPACWSIYNKDD